MKLLLTITCSILVAGLIIFTHSKDKDIEEQTLSNLKQAQAQVNLLYPKLQVQIISAPKNQPLIVGGCAGPHKIAVVTKNMTSLSVERMTTLLIHEYFYCNPT